MKYLVKKTFVGTPISGQVGKEVEIKSEKVAADLIKAGYIEEKTSKKSAAEKKTDENW